MKKRATRKLTLRRETIREVNQKDLARVDGGFGCTEELSSCDCTNEDRALRRGTGCTCDFPTCPGG